MQFINSTLSVDSLSELVSFCKLSKFSFLVKDISALRGQTLEIKKKPGKSRSGTLLFVSPPKAFHGQAQLRFSCVRDITSILHFRYSFFYSRNIA